MTLIPLYMQITPANLSAIGAGLSTIGSFAIWYFVVKIAQVDYNEVVHLKKLSLTIPSWSKELRREMIIKRWGSLAGLFLTVLGGLLQVLATINI